MSDTNVVTNFIAGGVGGSCAVITGHPFDTVKVRLQTMPKPAPGQPPLFTGALDCVRQTVAREGFFALYKGMAAPLVGVSPLFAVFFGGTALGKWLLQNEPGQQLDFKQNFTAGAIAGVFTTAVMVPGERIKCILQVQSMDGSAGTTPKYTGPVDVVRKLYREGGIRSIYRGTAATLLRDIPASGAYIAVYELLKDKFSGGERNELTPMATLLAGGFAGIANWSVCIPADVMKSRLQTAPEGKYPSKFFLARCLSFSFLFFLNFNELSLLTPARAKNCGTRRSSCRKMPAARGFLPQLSLAGLSKVQQRK